MLVAFLLLLVMGLWFFLGPLLNKDGFRRIYSREGTRFNLYRVFDDRSRPALLILFLDCC
jgi:hypothetical protein